MEGVCDRKRIGGVDEQVDLMKWWKMGNGIVDEGLDFGYSGIVFEQVVEWLFGDKEGFF